MIWFFSRKRHQACLLLLFWVMAAPCQAEKIRTLNEENVAAFILQATRVIAGHANNLSDKQIEAYLERHLHMEGRFKSTMKYHMPGYPEHEVSMSLGKKEFIEGIRHSDIPLDDYDNNVTILDIRISSDKKKATVKSQNTESAVMQVATEGQAVPITGQSICTQIMTLNKGFIQMYHASCETNIEFMEGY